jgi:hypothetical protein
MQERHLYLIHNLYPKKDGLAQSGRSTAFKLCMKIAIKQDVIIISPISVRSFGHHFKMKVHFWRPSYRIRGKEFIFLHLSLPTFEGKYHIL